MTGTREQPAAAPGSEPAGSSHIVVTSYVLDSWRSFCGCGWRTEARRWTTAFMQANAHLDDTASAPAAAGRTGRDGQGA